MEPHSDEKAGYTRRLGRRTSDWLIPVVMWTVALSSLLAARHFYQRAVAAENINNALHKQVQLLERIAGDSTKFPSQKP